METFPDTQSGQPSGREQAPFPTTDWRAVQAGGDAADLGRRCEALERLLPRYLPQLKAHLGARFRLSPEAVEDALHDFVLDRILIGNLLGSADRSRGRFRTFLLHALDNHVRNALRQERAQRRCPPEGFVPLENVSERLPIDGETPTPPEDRLWARAVFREAADRMRADCRAAGNENLWRVFEGRVVAVLLDGAEAQSYEDLARACSTDDLQEVRLWLASGKRMFRRVLREVVREYARSEQELEEDVATIRTAFYE
jgi:DNA-directed RNA polymerase specialized sigma24 family protein